MPAAADHDRFFARRRWMRTVLAGGGTLALPALAQSMDRPLDVPFVPTSDETVDRMLRMAGVGPKDYVIDLGSGDGRIVITAAKQFGATGFGVELNTERWKLSLRNAEKEGVSDRATFYQRDLFETDLSKATVLTMYLLPAVNLKLRPRILALRPGTRVVSHDFDMAEWMPDARADRSWTRVYLWIVPARVEGEWSWKQAVGRGAPEFTMELRQQFQVISGSVRIDNEPYWLTDARLRGDEISFTVIGDAGGVRIRHEYSGRVAGDAIKGTVRMVNGDNAAPQSAPWTVVRVPKKP
ncbi:MAG: methyltransferase domain-containing protein [Burkholderiales bacterium]|nr:methyltransferase domain-containing protein [Burkholderiales bacterium]